MRLSDRNNVYIVNNTTSILSVCPVCDYLARDFKDLESIQKEKACCECTVNFKYLDLESWNRGARPEKSIARSKIILHVGEIKNEQA